MAPSMGPDELVRRVERLEKVVEECGRRRPPLGWAGGRDGDGSTTAINTP